MIIKQIKVGPEVNFAYVLGDTASRTCVLIDPAYEVDRVLAEVKRLGFETVSAVIATHHHLDHSGGNREVRERTGARSLIHELDRPWVDRRGIPVDDVLRDGDRIPIGSLALEVLHTPGHSPGACCFRLAQALFTGDTLFVGQCGRTDLPGGSPLALFQSLQGRLAALPDELVVYPGHDYGRTPTATLGSEKRTNPTLLANTFDAFDRLP